MRVNTTLLFIIIVLLSVVIYQNHTNENQMIKALESNEAQMLIWLEDIELRVKSIETHLMKTDSTYTQTR